MAFGRAPCIPAHETNNPILPRRDRTLEAKKSNPAVPRAPRAKRRANSCGVLAREQKKDSANSSLNSFTSNSSMQRLPPESGYSDNMSSYARVNHLHREKHSVENQVFEMGPRIRASSLDMREAGDFARGHALENERAGYKGMPWSQPKERDDEHLPKGRVSTLHHERQDADQARRDEQQEALGAMRVDGVFEMRSHARVNIHARELKDSHQTLEMAPMVQVSGFEGPTGKYHGRRNIMAREGAEESTDAPRACGFADNGAPVFNRKQMLPPCIPRGANVALLDSRS